MIPDVGTIEQHEGGHPVFRFSDLPVEPREPASASVGQQTTTRLRRAIWEAVTAFHPPEGGWKLDLETLRPITVLSDPGGLLTAQPERFVSLPDAGVDFQQGLVRAFAIEKNLELPGLDALLAQPAWHVQWHNLLTERGLVAEWVQARTDGIVEAVLAWADRQGIPRGKLIEQVPLGVPVSARRRPGAAVSAVPSPGDATASEVRQLLHELVDALSDSEVFAFPIPSWCLRIPRRGFGNQH